jgi:sugar phosphate isomerase/epimerase
MPRVGFRFVEFNCWYPRTITLAKMRDLVQRCQEAGLTPIAIHGTSFGGETAGDLTRDVAHKLHMMVAAQELGCRRIVASGAARGTGGGIAAIVTVLKEILPAAEEQDVLVCLENHADNTLENIDDYQQIFDRIDSPNLGICLDTGHFDAAGVDIDALIDTLGAKVNHVHVKENLGRGSQNFVRFGAGTTDNHRVINRMLANGYTGYITVELSPQQDTSTIPEDLSLARAMFAPYESEFAGTAARID